MTVHPLNSHVGPRSLAVARSSSAFRLSRYAVLAQDAPKPASAAWRFEESTVPRFLDSCRSRWKNHSFHRQVRARSGNKDRAATSGGRRIVGEVSMRSISSPPIPRRPQMRALPLAANLCRTVALPYCMRPHRCANF